MATGTSAWRGVGMDMKSASTWAASGASNGANSWPAPRSLYRIACRLYRFPRTSESAYQSGETVAMRRDTSLGGGASRITTRAGFCNIAGRARICAVLFRVIHPCRGAVGIRHRAGARDLPLSLLAGRGAIHYRLSGAQRADGGDG